MVNLKTAEALGLTVGPVAGLVPIEGGVIRSPSASRCGEEGAGPLMVIELQGLLPRRCRRRCRDIISDRDRWAMSSECLRRSHGVTPPWWLASSTAFRLDGNLAPRCGPTPIASSPVG
jgi:hypothetical protein